MNPFDRKGCLTTLLVCLDHWQQQAHHFPTDKDLVKQLIGDCMRDHRKGVTDPVPWFALADLLEEHGRNTYIRRIVGRLLDLPGFSQKEWRATDPC